MPHQELLLHGKNGYDISCLEWVGGKATSVLICLHGFAGDIIIDITCFLSFAHGYSLY